MDVVRQPSQGWIEVIVGSMFSGKSEELIRRLRRAQIARQKVQIFKPVVDRRYSDDHIVSHSEMRIESCAVPSSSALVDKVAPDTEVVGIDEGQFFDQELPMICDTLANQGKRVIVAGLDQDYLGKPFHVEELRARIQALLRRGSVKAAHLSGHGVELDEEHQAAIIGTRTEPLTGLEFRLLRCFMQHPSAVLSKSYLGEHVYGLDADPDSNVIEVYVNRLRQKVGKDVIQTRRGQGYVFADARAR